MAGQLEESVFEPEIYQLETADPVEGGVGGISNLPLLQLANRTLWLKNRQDEMWRTGDVKEVDCTNAYITANFDGTGLGINERVGWAICNGNNGTKNRNGRVGLAYGSSYPTMGAVGGNKDAVVLAHTHDPVTFQRPFLTQNGNGVPITYRFDNAGSHDTPLSTDFATGGVTGGGATATDKNLQPYIVSLFIQKL